MRSWLNETPAVGFVPWDWDDVNRSEMGSDRRATILTLALAAGRLLVSGSLRGSFADQERQRMADHGDARQPQIGNLKSAICQYSPGSGGRSFRRPGSGPERFQGAGPSRVPASPSAGRAGPPRSGRRIAARRRRGSRDSGRPGWHEEAERHGDQRGGRPGLTTMQRGSFQPPCSWRPHRGHEDGSQPIASPAQGTVKFRGALQGP
jgi:hypothetical protein